MTAAVHETAVIDPSAKIDPSVKIGPYAVIGEHVTIGADCVIGAHAVVEHVVMGTGNTIHPGAFIGTPPQDLKFAGEHSMLVMGDNNTIRECVTLNRGTKATGETRIGSNCLFMAYTHAAHDCRFGNNVIVANGVAVAGHIEVGDFTVIGGLVAIHQFVRIGRYCMLGGGSMVGKDVPPFCTTQGDRAKLRGLNLLGLRRAGMGRDAVKAIKTAYNTLFATPHSLAPGLAELKRSEQCAEVKEMMDFVEVSMKGRGVTGPAAGKEAEEAVTI